MSQMPSGISPVFGRLRRSFAGLGDLTLLFGAALAGALRRPFYWQEFVGQCRTILTGNFVPILLTGSGLGFFVSIEAGQFFKAFSSLYRLGGFEVMSNIRELSPVATGLMIAGVSGTAIVAMSWLSAVLVGMPLLSALVWRPGRRPPRVPTWTWLARPARLPALFLLPVILAGVAGWATLSQTQVQTNPALLMPPASAAVAGATRWPGRSATPGNSTWS